jgi:hypothetical protein
MKTISIWQLYELFPTYRSLQPGADVLADLSVVCLWAMLGAILTGLFLAMGLGVETGQALGAPG